MHRRISFLMFTAAAFAVSACGDRPTAPAARTIAPGAAAADASSDPNDVDGDGVPNAQDAEPTLGNIYNYVTWTAANPLAGTASGSITLPGGHTVGVQFRVVQSSGAAGRYFAAIFDAGSGPQSVADHSIGNLAVANYWQGPNNYAPYKSAYVLNGPTNTTMLALTGGTTDSYVLTFSEPVQDPVMDILSLGVGGNPAEYDFGREFELLSQDRGFFGGGTSSMTVLPGQKLKGSEGNGAVRFVGSMSTLSWTVPDGEVFHNFTVAIRGLADPNADHDNDGVADAIDNCPTTSNAGQADVDFDGVGDACDPVNDPNVDTDGDALTNSQEHALGTSPTNPDTDGDGFRDDADVFPLDASRHTDTTAPVVTFSVDGTQGANGWYTSDVTVSWTVSDPESAITSQTGCDAGSVMSNTTADGVTFTCSATSAGGTTPQSVTIKVDKTVPTVTGAVTSGTLGANGWYTTDVGATWTPSAAGPSGQTLSPDCAQTSLATDAASHTFNCTVTTGAGVASAQGTLTVKRDAQTPHIAYSLTGTTGDNGWYVSDVGVVWTTTAGPSGVNTCSSAPVGTDGTNITFSCTATAGNGKSSTVTTAAARRDATRPVVTYTGNAGSYTVDQHVNIACTPSDNLSGIASSTCQNIAGDGYLFAIGNNGYTASARDKAGNVSTSATASFTMAVTQGSLCALVERWTNNHGVANSLCVKLAHHDYAPFRSELKAQSGKHVAADKAAILLALVNDLD